LAGFGAAFAGLGDSTCLVNPFSCLAEQDAGLLPSQLYQKSVNDPLHIDTSSDEYYVGLDVGIFVTSLAPVGEAGSAVAEEATAGGAADTDEETLLARANAARDSELQRLTGVRSADRPATIVGAYNASTGNVVVGQSSKELLECAEACAVRLDGGDPADIFFTRAARPRGAGPFPDVPVCADFCEPAYGRSAFPDPATRFASDGALVGEEFLP